MLRNFSRIKTNKWIMRNLLINFCLAVIVAMQVMINGFSIQVSRKFFTFQRLVVILLQIRYSAKCDLYLGIASLYWAIYLRPFAGNSSPICCQTFHWIHQTFCCSIIRNSDERKIFLAKSKNWNWKTNRRWSIKYAF